MDDDESRSLPTFGARMRWARERAHKTQRQAAEFCGKDTHMTVGNWESGANFPELESLVAVAELYGVSIDWLVWGGSVAKGIDARVRGIPDMLRPGLIDRLHREIDETQEAAKRLPKEMLAQGIVKDADARLSEWSAANLKRSGKKKAKAPKAKTKGGTQ